MIIDNRKSYVTNSFTSVRKKKIYTIYTMRVRIMTVHVLCELKTDKMNEVSFENECIKLINIC